MPQFSDRGSAKIDRSDGEFLRWTLLIGATLWLVHPFFSGRAIGSGDAVWYEHMLADFVLQLRSGAFPVFVGQTEYAFNGAVYPLRVAPLFQHWGGLIDFITLHRLSFFWIQHLTVITVAVLGSSICYICLASINRERRWAALCFSLLYITCPGAIALIATQDLYMSWMAVPCIPPLMLGLVRSFERDGFLSWALIASSLAALWMAHAPIALWATLIAAAVQLYRLIFVARNISAWRGAIVAGFAFILLAQYPFLSAATLRTKESTGGALDHPEKILDALNAAFPGSILPLSPDGMTLADVQLGYALFAALLVALVAAVWTKTRRAWICIIPALALLLLLIPIPGWSKWFWLSAAPEFLRRLTFYWPMQRLYLLIDGLAVFAGTIGTSAILKDYHFLKRPAQVLGLVALCWSFVQSSHFTRTIQTRTATKDDTLRDERPENRLLMNHSYGLFPKLPSTFSNGVVNPSAEFSFDSSQQKIEEGVPGGSIVNRGAFISKWDNDSGVLDLTPTFTLYPGRSYELLFNFSHPDYQGVLQLTGATFFRQYILPSSGMQAAFGAAPDNSKTLSLWTTSQHPETIKLRFIPDTKTDPSIGAASFASYILTEQSLDHQRVRVLRWVPLSATVLADRASVLVTPRMYIPGYVAEVNGGKVLCSANIEGFLRLPVPRGESHIKVSYEGPLSLRISYWSELFAWIAFFFYTACYRFASKREHSIIADVEKDAPATRS